MKKLVLRRNVFISLMAAVMVALTACAESEITDIKDMDAICGMWVMASYEDESGYYIAEDYDTSGQMYIYNEGDKLHADYFFSRYMETVTMNGMVVAVDENHRSDGISEELFSATLQNRWDESLIRTVTLLNEKELLYCEKYLDTEYGYTVQCTFFKEGSEELENIDELRYRETVTVATVEELAEAIQNSTRVILEEGMYNFSELNAEDVQNSNLGKMESWNYGWEYVITNVSDFCLEAEEGAQVTICIDDPYAAVLSFDSCRNIALRGLICGHLVEPGHCTGSVVYVKDSTNVAIDHCRLYGSGTYGVQTMGVDYLMVTETEIFDCTYGLLSLSNTTNAVFRECSMSDSRDLSMFEFSSCSDLIFDTCEITGNVSDYGGFINSINSYYIQFQNCVFNENTYELFINEVDEYQSDYENISFENCTMDGKAM